MVMRAIVLALGLSCVAANAAVKTDLTRSSLPITDSFRVIYTVDGQAARPDFSPLQQDFQVLGTSQSTSVTVVNDRMQESTSFIIDLMARREGELTLPSIDFGVGRSEPLTVTVTAAESGAAATDGEEIFIEIEAEPATPYVQAQVRFTLRIFRAVRTSEAALTEPEVVTGEAVIERIGEDLVYETTRGGARYSVVERRYALFPQSSGELAIAPMTFDAVVGGRRSLFEPRARGRRVRVRSEAMEFDVQPIPESFTGRTWLPAERLELTEQWPGAASEQWRVGEPLTRTLTLRARGLTASQLAGIGAQVPDGVKQYTDQPELEQAAVDGSIVAVRRETVALIPSRAGRFELPEIAVPWWNTVEDRLEYARVPARAITVLPAAGAPDQAAGPAAVTAPAVTAATDERSSVQPVPGQPNAWVWLSAVLALGWLTTLALWIWSRGRTVATTSPQPGPQPPKPKAVIADLERACAANDKDTASRALLLWGATRWPGSPVRSLGELAARLDGQFQSEVHRLSRARYASSADVWNGAALWNAFQSHRKTRTKQERSQGPQLEPLYR